MPGLPAKAQTGFSRRHSLFGFSKAATPVPCPKPKHRLQPLRWAAVLCCADMRLTAPCHASVAECRCNLGRPCDLRPEPLHHHQPRLIITTFHFALYICCILVSSVLLFHTVAVCPPSPRHRTFWDPAASFDSIITLSTRITQIAASRKDVSRLHHSTLLIPPS